MLGPITVLARRPSLQVPVDDADVLHRRGSIMTLARVSAFHSETYRGQAPQGDPPQWAIQVLPGPQSLRNLLHTCSPASYSRETLLVWAVAYAGWYHSGGSQAMLQSAADHTTKRSGAWVVRNQAKTCRYWFLESGCRCSLQLDGLQQEQKDVIDRSSAEGQRVQALAAQLRERTGLSLINFDLIQPVRSKPGVPAVSDPSC